MSVSSAGSDASFASEHGEGQGNKDKQLQDGNGEGGKNLEEGDAELFEQEKSWQELFFATLNTLSAEKAFLYDWRVNTAKVVLEGLTGFLVVFNPVVKGWSIDTDLWFWQIMSWAVYHAPVAFNRGYETYLRTMYVHVALVALLLAAFGGLFLMTVKKVTPSKGMRKAIKALHFCMDVVFSVGFMTIFSVFVFMLNCNFTSEGEKRGMHVHYTSVDCSAAPHLGHMVVAAVFALLLTVFSVCLAIADSELNPVVRYPLASPSAFTRVKIVITKVFLLVCAGAINSSRKGPVIIMWLAALYIWWLYFVSIPFYNQWVSHAITGMWLGTAYAASILMVGTYDGRTGDPDWHEWMTWSVLKGIFPVVAGSFVCQWLMLQYKMSKVKYFKNQPSNVVLRKIYNFYWQDDVKLMARVMRKYDADGNVDPAAVDLGELIIRAGMAYYPNSPELMVLHAIVLLELKHDGPSARSDLLAAAKQKPNIITRYKIFVATERARKLRNTGEGALNLQTYVEFKRNYRGLARVHRKALKAQRDFWKLFMHSDTHVDTVRAHLAALERVAGRAQYAYRKIMERYPNNGKVLKCYGKFLEEVKNDISAATKYYTEGNRLGSTDAMMNMDFDFAAQKKMDMLVNMNMHEDAVIIIDAVGTILMTSQGAMELFGYNKRELEGSNVSLLMPQPFSQRHPSYLSRYTSTGEAHILDKPQQVVALHKDKFVFPVDLGVTKLSGTGADCIFLGVLKPCPATMGNMRCWVSPTGFVLCCDQQFSGLVGLPTEAMVGRQLSTLVVDVAGIDAFLARCRVAPAADFASNQLSTSVLFVNKYIPPIPTTVTAKLNGTDLERIFVLEVQRAVENEEMMMVCDSNGAITFCTSDMAALIGVSTQKLLSTKLESLLPPPYNSMHTKWLKDTPPTVQPNSCRAGAVVQLLNSSNVLVPVRLRVHQMEENSRMLHVIRVRKVSPNEMLDDKRVSFVTDLNGLILGVEPEDSLLFGWPVADFKGQLISDVVDLINVWRQRVADCFHGGSVEHCLAESGTGGVKVFMLSLIDNELSKPGSSFRVAVKPPNVDFATANAAAQKSSHQGATLQELLHNKQNMNMLQAARRAVMWPEAIEVDGLPALKLHLYKQDALTGYLELETDLSIRKADTWASLIFGLPSAMLVRKKLHELLHVDAHSSWEQLMGIEAQTGGLTRVNRGTVTAPRTFIADHADGGTVRITLQGVSKSEGLGNKNRIEATVHADISYQEGSPHIMFEQLGMDEDEDGKRMANMYKHMLEGVKLSRHRYIKATQETQRPGSSSSAFSRRSNRKRSSNGWGESKGGKRISDGSSSQQSSKPRPRQKERFIRPPRKLSRLPEGDTEGDGDEDDEDKDEDGDTEGEGSSEHGEGGEGQGMSTGQFTALGLDGMSMPGGGASQQSGSGSGNVSANGGSGEQGEGGGAKKGGGAGMQGSDEEEEEDFRGSKVEEEERRKAKQKKEQIMQWIQSTAESQGSGEPERGSSPEERPRSRAKPILISIDEEGTEKMLEGEDLGKLPAYVPRHLRKKGNEPREPTEDLVDLRESPEPEPEPDADDNADWERQVAEMPDEAIIEEKEKKSKGKRSGHQTDDNQPAKPGDDNRSESSAGEGASEVGSASVASSNSAHDEILVDTRRGRLLKKLVGLVRGPSLALPLSRLSRRSLLNICAIVAVHVIFFAIFMAQAEMRHGQLETIFRHGTAIDRSQIVYYRALLTEHCLQLASEGKEIPEGNMCYRADSNPEAVLEGLDTAVEDYSLYHQEVYLGPGDEVRMIVDPEARAVWNDDTVALKMYMDTTPPSEIMREKGLWEAGNRLAYSGRELQVAYTNDPSSIGETRAFYYVRENARDSIFENYVRSLDLLSLFIYDNQTVLAEAIIAFIIVEAVVVLTLLHLYQLKLIVDVERARLGGVLAMVGLPNPVLVLMHRKPLMILENDSDEEQEEEETGEMGKQPRTTQQEEAEHEHAIKAVKEVARRSASKDGTSNASQKQLATNSFNSQTFTLPANQGQRSSMLTYVQNVVPVKSGSRFRFKSPLKLPRKLRYNGKNLVSSWAKVFKMMLPFFLWQLAVLIVWAVTASMVEDMKGPVVSLSLAMRVVYRFSHVRATAMALVTQDSNSAKDDWKSKLSTQVELLAEEYDSLLYGGLPSSMEDSVFNFQAPAVTFESQDLKHNFFEEKKCFRADQSTCVQPGHPFYEVSREGLDAMMQRMLNELRLLVTDENEAINYRSQRLDYMHQIGSNDITDGLQSTAELFTEHTTAKYDEIKDVQIALMVITAALAVMYVYFVLRPYERAVKHEANTVAGLLSHTPREMDARRHLLGALQKASPDAV